MEVVYKDMALTSIAAMAEMVPELHLQSLVMSATASGSIDRILGLGTNAAQAAAQPMRASGKPATSSLTILTEAEQQALAVIALNGVTMQPAGTNLANKSELLEFAEAGSNARLMNSGNPFIREIACLHGIVQSPRHPEMLESVFDEDEDFAIDAVDQLQQSLSPMTFQPVALTWLCPPSMQPLPPHCTAPTMYMRNGRFP